MKLTRRPRFDGSDLPAWSHPNGWNIRKTRRDWSLRGYTRGAAHQWQPLEWYEVFHRSVHVETFTLLREAREWCDTHKRVYQSDSYVVVEVRA